MPVPAKSNTSKPNNKNSNRRVTDYFKPLVKDASSPPTSTPPPPPKRATTPKFKPSVQLRSGEGTAAARSKLASSEQPSSSPSSQEPPKPRVVPSSEGEESSDDSDLDYDPFALSLLDAPPSPQKPTRPRHHLDGDDDDELGAASLWKPTPKRAHEYSLQRLLEEERRAQELDLQVKHAKELIEAAENGPNNATADPAAAFTQDTADQIMGERGKGARLLEALDRKDALRVDEIWNFFDPSNPVRKSKLSFPTDSHEILRRGRSIILPSFSCQAKKAILDLQK